MYCLLSVDPEGSLTGQELPTGAPLGENGVLCRQREVHVSFLYAFTTRFEEVLKGYVGLLQNSREPEGQVCRGL